MSLIVGLRLAMLGQLNVAAGAGGVSAPTVQTREPTVSAAANAGSFTPTIPTGSGGALIAFITSDGDVTLSTSSTGWVKLGQDSMTALVTGAVFYKLVSTGSDALVVTASAAEQFSGVIYRVDHGNTLNIAGAFSKATSTNSDPPNVAIGSTQAALLLVSRQADNQGIPSAAPTNYINMQQAQGGSSAGATTNTAERTATVSSEDPGAWTSASEDWVSATVALWETI